VTASALFLGVLVGSTAGLASGLLGIGGGLVMVPFLYVLMEGTGWSGVVVPADYQAAVAHATSLAVIAPTAVSGLLAFRREGVVDWATVAPLGPAAAAAALLGARVAVSLPTPLLKTAFGLVILVTGIRMLKETAPAAMPASIGRSALRWWVALPAGAVIGFLSALLGVGGGVVAIPILLHWARMDLRRVAPVSIAIMVLAAPVGVLGYAVAGRSLVGMPSASIGYVFLPAAAAMVPGAIALAPLGARWNQRMPTATLRRLFAMLLMVVGAELIWSNALEPLFRP
jgi:uncharacterized membrane protein YfcA